MTPFIKRLRLSLGLFLGLSLAITILASAANAATISVTSNVGNVHLIDSSGALVDFNDNPTPTNVGGGSRALAWNPITGDLYSNNSDVLWRNDGTGWSNFADLSALSLAVGTAGSLAIGASGEIAVADDAGDIFLLDAAGNLIDFNGNATASSIGGSSRGLAWDPVSGALFTHNSSTLWRNDGTGWSNFANLFALGLDPGTDGSIAIGSAGQIALSDNLGNIFLLDGTGALIDFSGSPTSGSVGSGALALAWDPTSGDLYSNNSNVLWSNDGSGWMAFADLAAQGLAVGTNASLAIATPEPTSAILLLTGCAILFGRKRNLNNQG